MADVGRFLARLFGTGKRVSGPKAKSMLEVDLLEGRAVPSATVTTAMAVDPTVVQSDSPAIIRVADAGATTQTGPVVVAQSGQTDTDPTVVSLAPTTQTSGSSQTMVVNNPLGQLPGPVTLQSGQSGQTTGPIMVSGQSGQTLTGPITLQSGQSSQTDTGPVVLQSGQSGQTLTGPVTLQSGQSGQTVTGPVVQSGQSGGEIAVDPIIVDHHSHGPEVFHFNHQPDQVPGPIVVQSAQSTQTDAGQTVQSAS